MLVFLHTLPGFLSVSHSVLVYCQTSSGITNVFVGQITAGVSAAMATE